MWPWSGWFLGLFLGALHAFEPDHLAAVATLVSTDRRRPALMGALWGLGHAAVLLTIGGALVVWRMTLPPSLATAFEAGVACLLLALGVRSLWAAARTHRAHARAHAHDHAHPHTHAHLHIGHTHAHLHIGHSHDARGSARPLWVGFAHGLAGTGALTTLALASMPSVGSALVYLVWFCVGSVAAMSLATGLFGWPLGRIARNLRLRSAVMSAAGAFSLAVGARMLATL